MKSLTEEAAYSADGRGDEDVLTFVIKYMSVEAPLLYTGYVKLCN
jgi:hypothetical protein